MLVALGTKSGGLDMHPSNTAQVDALASERPPKGHFLQENIEGRRLPPATR